MTDLTDRYVERTLRSIPENQRTDIEAELRASIGDAVEARVDDGEDPESAARDVLTRLGDPDRLAAGYTGRPSHLIGPEHFFDYKRLLTVLLVTVVPVVVVIIAVLETIAGGDVGDVFGHAIGVGISLILHIAFWTTLVFYLIERSGEQVPTSEWTPSSLPPLPTTTSIKLGDTIGAMVFLVIAIAALTFSRTVSPVTTDDGTAVPFFDPAIWDFWMPFLIGVLAVEVLFEVAKYRSGRWTWPLASANLALNVAFVVPTIYLLVTDRVLNPEFFAGLGWAGAPQAGDTVVTVAVVVVALVATWDIVEGFRRARKMG